MLLLWNDDGDPVHSLRTTTFVNILPQEMLLGGFRAFSSFYIFYNMY
jgi:hypothetical protein